MIYVYGFTDACAALPQGLTGIDDAPLALVHCGEVSAIISVTPVQRIAVVDANLWKHEEVLERMCIGGAVLPSRYGAVLRDERELYDLIAANEPAFIANLARVRDKVELSLRVLWNDDKPAMVEQAAPGVSGQAYMRARLQEERVLRAWRERAQAKIDWIDAALSPLSVEHTHKVLATPRLLLTAAYLVERVQIACFRDGVSALSACDAIVSESGLRFMCTGPWPAYNFVDINVTLPEERKKSEAL